MDFLRMLILLILTATTAPVSADDHAISRADEAALGKIDSDCRAGLSAMVKQQYVDPTDSRDVAEFKKRMLDTSGICTCFSAKIRLDPKGAARIKTERDLENYVEPIMMACGLAHYKAIGQEYCNGFITLLNNRGTDISDRQRGRICACVKKRFDGLTQKNFARFVKKSNEDINLISKGLYDRLSGSSESLLGYHRSCMYSEMSQP